MDKRSGWIQKSTGIFRKSPEKSIPETPYCGIYYILDAVVFPTQIIVTRELPDRNHRWLKALSEKLKTQELKELLEEISGLTQRLDRELADAVLDVSVRANPETLKELRGDERMYQALLEILEPEISEMIRDASEKTRKETEDRTRRENEDRTRREMIKSARKMLDSGKFSVEEIAEYLPGLSPGEIRRIL